MKTRILSVIICSALTLGMYAQNTEFRHHGKPEQQKECFRKGGPEGKMNHRHHHQARMMSAEEMAAFKANRMKEDLALTEEQYNEVYAIFLTQAKDREDFHKAEAEKMREQAAQRHDLAVRMHQQTDDKLKNILTPEQFEKWQAKRKERAERPEMRP